MIQRIKTTLWPGILILLTAMSATAQKKAHLTFDSSGRLTAFPPAIVRTGSNICMKVAVSAHYIRQQMATFRTRLEIVSAKLKEDNTFDSYYCYFQQDKFNTYLNSLDTLIKYLDTTLLLQSGSPDKYISYLIDRFDTDKHVPGKAFLENTFRKQFEARIMRGSTIAGSVMLNKVAFDKEKHCFYFSSDCQKIKDFHCNDCGASAPLELSIQLIHTDPFSQTVKEWFEEQNQWLVNLTSLTNIQNSLKNIAGMATVGKPFIDEHKNITTLKPWFLNWLWYTNGELVLDPFNAVTKAGNLAIKESIKETDEKINNLKPRKNFIDSVLKNIDYKLNRYAAFKHVQQKSKALNKELEDLLELKKDLEKKLNQRSADYPEIQPKSFLNNVDLLLTEGRKIHPQIQFDGKKKYNQITGTKRQLNRTMEIPDNETAVVIVHNVDSSISLTFDQHRLGFADNEEVTEWLSQLLSQANAISTSIPNIGKLQNTIREYVLKPGDAGAPPLADSIFVARAEALKEVCKSFPDLVFKKLVQLGNDFKAGQVTFAYTQSIFIGNAPATPLLTSHTELVKFYNESPFKDSFVVKQKTGTEEKEAFKTNINVGKLRFVQVAAGIAITDKAVTQSTIDTSGNGFRINSADNKAKAIIGFKIYPFQYYARDRWLRPRYLLHRISFFGGFEILHPLDNFYIGGCYDLVPGIGFSVGKNIYLKTRYKIENNAITNTSRTYDGSGAYYSVVVNPVLFVEFVKLFFK